jgi:hypothetical protein
MENLFQYSIPLPQEAGCALIVWEICACMPAIEM